MQTDAILENVGHNSTADCRLRFAPDFVEDELSYDDRALGPLIIRLRYV